MFRARKEARPIYGATSKPKPPCVLTIPPEQDINTYLDALVGTLTSLAQFNNKNNAIELLTTIETTITNVITTEQNTG
jgi:hypothetical protein